MWTKPELLKLRMFSISFSYLIPFQNQISYLELFVTSNMLIKPSFNSLLMIMKFLFLFVSFLLKFQKSIYSSLEDLYYLGVINNLKWDCFSPFRKLISSSENILMLFRRIQIDLTNYIQSPLFEGILNSHGLKWECRSSFFSCIHLTYLTFRRMCMCIFE